MKYKIIYPAVVVVWAAGIYFLLGRPIPESMPSSFLGADKVVHFFLFAGLSYFINAALAAWRPVNRKIYPAAAAAAAGLYAVGLEWWQSFVPGRLPLASDLLFGWLGAASVSLLWRSRLYRPRLLLHVCCAACAAYVAGELKKNFRVVMFFHNPNIFPADEYERRRRAAAGLARWLGVKALFGAYEHEGWRAAVRGHEHDPERGERCVLCYCLRLRAAANAASRSGIPYFTTTLTVSPHKDAVRIRACGRDLARELGLIFHDRDFKKNDGFNKAVRLSRKLSIYRQDYCGCEFSRAAVSARAQGAGRGKNN